MLSRIPKGSQYETLNHLYNLHFIDGLSTIICFIFIIDSHYSDRTIKYCRSFGQVNHAVHPHRSDRLIGVTKVIANPMSSTFEYPTPTHTSSPVNHPSYLSLMHRVGKRPTVELKIESWGLTKLITWIFY